MARPILTDQDYGSVARPIGIPAPTAADHAANKAYVDAAIEGLAWKDSVRAASTANITLTGPGTSVDGVALANNDRVLVKNQTTAADNGIYVFNGSAVAMTRAADANTFDELEQAVTTVEEGSSAGASFRQSAVNGTLGTTAVNWTTFGTAAAAATETVAGVAMLATQAKTDAGTDDLTMVTPLKLATYAGGKKKAMATIGDGSATSFNLDHNFGTRDVQVAVYKNSGNYDDVIADVTRPSINRVTIAFAAAPAASAYRVVVLG